MTRRAARRRTLRDVDSVQTLAGVGEQNRCPNGNEDCAGPNGPGLSCYECFWGESE